jgi:hypothetical protein
MLLNPDSPCGVNMLIAIYVLNNHGEFEGCRLLLHLGYVFSIVKPRFQMSLLLNDDNVKLLFLPAEPPLILPGRAKGIKLHPYPRMRSVVPPFSRKKHTLQLARVQSSLRGFFHIPLGR